MEAWEHPTLSFYPQRKDFLCSDFFITNKICDTNSLKHMSMSANYLNDLNGYTQRSDKVEVQ